MRKIYTIFWFIIRYLFGLVVRISFWAFSNGENSDWQSFNSMEQKKSVFFNHTQVKHSILIVLLQWRNWFCCLRGLRMIVGAVWVRCLIVLEEFSQNTRRLSINLRVNWNESGMATRPSAYCICTIQLSRRTVSKSAAYRLDDWTIIPNIFFRLRMDE